jgi:hypothetical protein
MSGSYGSIYFVNNGSITLNYLTSPANNNNLILTSNFTIEFWIKCPTQPDPYPTIMSQNAGWTPSTLNNYNIVVQHSYVGGNGLVIVWYGSAGYGNQIIKGVKALNDNVWHHVAVVRNGTVVTNYVDGIFDTSGTSSGTWDFGSNGITFGNNPNDNGSGTSLIGFNGYLSNIRIVKGTAVYTSNFTPPTSFLSAIPGTALLLNGSGSSFVDSSPYNITMTPSTAKPTISTSVLPSLSFPTTIGANISGFQVNGIDLGTIFNINTTVSLTPPMNTGYYVTVSGSQYDIAQIYTTPGLIISSPFTTGFITPSGYDLGKIMAQKIYSLPAQINTGLNGNIVALSIDSSNNYYATKSGINSISVLTVSGWTTVTNTGMAGSFVDTDSSNNYYTVTNNTVIAYNKSTASISTLTTGPYETRNWVLIGIICDKNNFVWVIGSNINGPMAWLVGNITGGTPSGLAKDTVVGSCTGANPGTTYAMGLDSANTNNLYFGGNFPAFNNVTASNIGLYNKSSNTFTTMGAGLNNTCRGIAVDSSNGYVYACGDFTADGLNTTTLNYVGRWNGTSWTALGNNTNNKLDASCNAIVYDSCNNIVYVGGGFKTINGGTMTTNYLAKWNANTNLWSGCGYGVNAPVKSLQLTNNGNKVNLYAGGNFSEYAIANTSLSGNFYKWNYASSNWSITSTGLTNGNIYFLTGDLCNNLYAGGSSITSSGTTQYIAKLSSGSSRWNMGSGINGTCYCIATDTSNNIYAGGSFNAANTGISYLASLRGTYLSLFPNTFNGQIFVIRYDKTGNLYAGGIFTTPGNRIAKWNGTTWSALGTGLNNTCYAIAFDNANNLYAGGSFLTAGGNSVARIAKWDGTNWSALGTGGVDSTCCTIEFDSNNNLYAGGFFTTVGGVSALRIARWDGTTWYALRGGLNLACYSIAIDSSNNVYASGDYTLADNVSGTARIAKWNGTSWSALGSGFNNNICYSIALDSSNNLYATGTFLLASSVTGTAYVAKWNGTSWSALGTGFDTNGYTVYVDTSTNKVYVSGAFTAASGNTAAKYGAIWNGTSWSAIGQGFTSVPATAFKFITKDPSGNILIGGFGSNMTQTTVSNIAKWNDLSWSAVGTTLGSTCYAITYDTSRNLLYAAGSFTTPTARIAQWNGTTWSAMGTGIASGTCYSLALDTSYNLYAGGNFTTAGGVTNANYIAKWDGSSWSALGTGLIGTYCYSIAIDSTNNIYTGGWANNKPAILKWDTSWCSLGNYNLTNTTNVPSTATTSLKIDNYNNLYATNTSHLNGFSRWNGSTWNDMGAIYPFVSTTSSSNYSSITNDMCNNIYVSTRETSSTVKTNTVPLIITSWNGTVVSTIGSANFNDICCAIAVDSSNNIYVGGCFTQIGSLQVNCIAMWNGSSWSSLGTGLNGACCTITIDSTNNVYVGGNFSTAGGVRVNYIAKWNGTAWSALSSGLSSSCASIALDTSGNLYAGGYFSLASGISVNFIAKWNGTAWSAMGSGLSTGGCSSVAVDTANNVFAGGYFTNAGGIAVNYIAKWNGTAWSALSTGLSNGCSSIVIDKSNNLYAGGYFTAAGEVNSLYIMKWNGTVWSGLGSSGLNEPCNTLAVDSSNNLYAGGNFVSAGGVYTNRLGKWNGTTWSDPFVNSFSSEVISIAVNKKNNTVYISNGLFQRFPATGIALIQ